MEDCMRGSRLASCLPTLTPPRAKKKRKKKLKERGRATESGMEYFGDPSQWWDVQDGKTSAGYPHTMSKSRRESLHLHGLPDRPPTQETFKKRDFYPDPEIDVKRKKRKGQLQQTVPFATDGTHCKSDLDVRVAISYVASLKVCAKQGDLQRGRKLHRIVDRRGLLRSNVFIGSALVNMYAKCGALEVAQEVFDKLPQRNLVSWNALISGYAQHGNGRKVWSCFERMKLEGLAPDAVTFSCILKICGSTGDLEKGQEMHDQILKERLFETDIVVANTLVDMYAKCGALEKAQEVFDGLPNRDIVSWTALITGYAQHGHGELALRCFEQMQLGGISPDAVTFSCVLKACGSIGALEKGEEIHAKIKKGCLLGRDVVIANALVDMYVKCGAFRKAQEVFEELGVWNLISWNGLIAGYTRHGLGQEALDCFQRMQGEGISPDAVTIATVLKACGILRDIDKGLEIHAQITRDCLLERDLVVAGALIDMYAKCGNMGKAQEVFDELTVTDIVSWTSLIGGYAEQGYGEEALNCYQRMQLAGFLPNAITFSCVLKACGNIGALDEGQKIHARIAKEKIYVEDDVVIGTALVDMYSKCGAFVKAREVFNRLEALDVVCWNTLIAGYVQHGHDEEAFDCFEQMQQERYPPDAGTFAWLLKACGSIGSVERGLRLHGKILKLGLMDKLMVDTFLVIMYANCGMLVEAEDVFGKLAVRDVVSWSVLMAGYAQLGRDEVVLDLFNRMICDSILPTSITFTIILNACSHRGLLKEGQFYFEILSNAYGIMPTLEHHSCMVDLFGRAGHLDNAIAVIEKAPVSADSAMWHTLLVACRNSVNNTHARTAFKHAVRLDENDDAAYVCMGDIFAAVACLQE